VHCVAKIVLIEVMILHCSLMYLVVHGSAPTYEGRPINKLQNGIILLV